MSSVEPLDLRAALGCFVTGVTVVTSVGPRGELIGITANSFSSVSLDPPLVLFSLSRRSNSWRAFLSTHHFAVNVLAHTQRALSQRFAQRGGDKWTGVRFERWESGSPILEGTLASFECEYRYTHDGGDHIIFVGQVMAMRSDPTRRPLVYYRGAYQRLVALPAPRC